MNDREVELDMLIGDFEVENRMVRERNERLEAEIKVVTEERDTAIKGYRDLLLRQDRIEQRTQK